MAWTPPSDAIAEQPVKETPGITGWTPPSDAVEVQGAWTPPSDAVLPSVPGPTPGLVSFINEPKKPEEKKVFTGSVFDTQPFEPEFDPAEAARLSRRAYAEQTTRPPRRVQEVRATPEEQIQRSALRAAGDTAIGVLQGAVAIPKGIVENIPFDNPLSQFYKDAYEAGEVSKSGYLRSKNVERAALLDNIRRNQGELAATRGAFTTMFSPSGADIVAQGSGSLIPALGMSVLNLGTKSMMAMNALANAGDAAQQTAARLAEMSPEDWSKSGAYQALREQGMDHRDAVRMLAPMYALPSQVIGGITGAVSGGTGLESALVKGAARSARARAGRAGVELLGEEAETLAPMLAGNITQRIIDDRTALLGGLGQAAVETAVAAGPGAGLAAAIAAPERRAEPSAERMARERGFLVETPKAEPAPAGDWEVVAEEPTAAVTRAEPEKAAPVEVAVEPVAPVAAPTAITPVVERMQEQQRAVQELEAEPEVEPAPIIQNASMMRAHPKYEEEILAPAREAIAQNNYKPVVLKDGTQVNLVVSQNEDNSEGRVIALDKSGQEVGQLMFTKVEDEEGNRFNPHAFVDDSMRRKGLATSMYDLAEASGAKIPPLEQPGQIRSEEGEAFRRARAGLPPQARSVAEEMEGVPAPLTEEAQAEVEKLTADQEAALAAREEMSKRTAGTSLMKVLKGTLNDGELSELGGRARQVGKNPFLNLKASKGQRGSSMEDMVESGALDLFLPDDMRPGHPNYDNAESAEYIREKLRVGEFYTYETERAIAEVDKDIAAIERQIQELLSEDEINKEIQYAVNEQRELDQAAAEPAPEEEAGTAAERAGEEEVLKPQTEEELRAKAKREEAAARKEEETRREEERKAAAPKAEEFVLTGSERAADEAAARGQQTFLNIEPVGESVAGDESTRAPSLKRKIKTLNRQREEGKISDQRFINEVDFAVKQDEEQRYKTAPRERVRGADFIRQKLLEAKRRGDLSAEGVELAEWFILQNEALVDDLGIAIKTPKEGGTAGMYNKLARIMVLMKEASNDSTIVHEILHHLERMMPAEVQAAIRTEWLGSMLRASRQAKTPQEKMFFAALINHHFGSGFTSDITIQDADAGKVLDSLIKRGVVEGPRASSYQLAIEMIRSGTIPYDRYQYVNPSEFWAVRGSDIVEGRFKAIKGDVLAKLKNWLKELAQKIKSIFGLRSDAPLIKALDSLAKGDGKFVSKDMLGEGENFLQVGKNIYNRRPLAQWTTPDETKLDDWIYKLTDKNVDTKRVIQSIEKSIGKLDDKWNPYLQEELYHGRTATQTKDFRRFEVRPLLQEMQKENVTIPEIEEYLHNRFAPIRNQNIAKINPEFPDDGTPGSGGSGIDTADAKAYMANLSPDQKAKYEKIAKMVDAITRNTRGYLVATGLEDVDTVMEWEKSSPDYVPLSRGDIDYGRSVGTGTGMGFSVRGPATRRATGSRRDVVNILANVITQREQAIVRGEKNRVATALYGLAVQNPNPEFWLAVNPDAKTKPIETEEGAPDLFGFDKKKLTEQKNKKKAIDELIAMGMSPADAEGLMQEPSQKVVNNSKNLVVSVVNPVLRSAENVLGVRVNGKDRFIYFNTQNPRAARMAQSLKGLDAEQLNKVLTFIGKITRYFASVNTQYNPIFGVYNFLRDIQGGAIQMAGTPIEDMRAEVLSPKNLAGAMRGIYQTVRLARKEKPQTMTPWADLWIDFQREGGQTGFRDQFSRSQERAEALQGELDRLSESAGKKAALAVPRAIFDWLADYNETLENAVRLTAYKAGLDKGLSREQAASVAKNLTVNFNRKGQVGVQAGAWFAFFNSAVQGTSRLLQTIAKMERPGDIKSLHLTSIGKKVVYGGFLLGVAQAMMMAAAGFDEDEPPDFVKDRNLIIPLPNGKYFAWPLPLGYHVIPAIGRILTEWAISGGKDSGKRIEHLAGLLMEAFNPIGNAGWSLQSIAPTILDPIVAIKENKDWTGKTIAKKDFNELDPTPGYTRAKQNASWFGKELSYLLNVLSGGDKDKPGIVSPTPDQIDYLIGQATGGLGREVMKASKTAEGLRTGEEIAPYNVPLVGRFYGDTKASYAESNKFYKNLEEVNVLENQLQGRQKRKEGTADFLKENPKVRLAPAAHSIERNIRQLRKQKEALVEKGAPKEQIKAIENRITLQMKKFNEKIENLEK